MLDRIFKYVLKFRMAMEFVKKWNKMQNNTAVGVIMVRNFKIGSSLVSKYFAKSPLSSQIYNMTKLFGDRALQNGILTFCKPFTNISVIPSLDIKDWWRSNVWFLLFIFVNNQSL